MSPAKWALLKFSVTYLNFSVQRESLHVTLPIAILSNALELPSVSNVSSGKSLQSHTFLGEKIFLNLMVSDYTENFILNVGAKPGRVRKKTGVIKTVS